MRWFRLLNSDRRPSRMNDRSRHLAAAARVEIPHSVGDLRASWAVLFLSMTHISILFFACPENWCWHWNHWNNAMLRRHSIATGSIRACGSCRPLLGSRAQFCQHSAIWSRWFWLAMFARSFHIEIVLKWALVERRWFLCRDLEQLGGMVNWNACTLQTIKCSVGVLEVPKTLRKLLDITSKT